MTRRHDPMARLMRYIEPDPFGGCWLWSGATLTNAGYGHLPIDGKSMAASRASWILHRGSIPPGMHVLHKCDIRLCCNPDHLFLGSHAENMADMARKGRAGARRGEASPKAKLDAEAVREIRRLLSGGATQREVSQRFSVHEATIQAVHEGRTWRHVTDFDGQGAGGAEQAPPQAA
jgi:hypothetical protein